MSEQHNLDTPFANYKGSGSNYKKVCDKCGQLQYHSLVFCPNCPGRFKLNKTMTWRTMIINNAKYSSSGISIYWSYLYFVAYKVNSWKDKNRRDYEDLPEPFASYRKEANALHNKHCTKDGRKIKWRK